MTLSPATFGVYLCCRLRLAVVPCLQYPDGDLQSFQIYRMNIERLREVIADAQPPPFPTAFLKPKVTLGARSSPPCLAYCFHCIALTLLGHLLALLQLSRFAGGSESDLTCRMSTLPPV